MWTERACEGKNTFFKARGVTQFPLVLVLVWAVMRAG